MSFAIVTQAAPVTVQGDDGSNQQIIAVDTSGRQKVLLWDANGSALIWVDVDSGAGTEYALPVSLRKSASGGSVEYGVPDAMAIPANTPGMLLAGKGSSGNARFLETVLDTEDSIQRLAITGKVSVQIPPPPPGATAVSVAADTPLDVFTSEDTDYVITTSKTFHIQQIIVGAEGDPGEKGSKIEVFFDDGAEHLVDRIYVQGTSLFGNYPDTSQSRDGTAITGNGTNKIIIRRSRLGGAALEIDSVIRGYEI
jgi:hypothetical protein